MAQTQALARKTLYNDPTFSDIKIRQIYKGKVTDYAAHKAVLCAQSGWFMTALTGRFKEASANTIDIHEDNPELFQAMMKLFYGMNLTTEAPVINANGGPHVQQKLVPIIGLHALADKYDAELLQRASADAFKRSTKCLVRCLTIAEVELLVHAHYPFCAITSGGMDHAFVVFILKKSTSLMQDIRLHSLVKQYGNFGADLFIEGMRADKLYVR